MQPHIRKSSAGNSHWVKWSMDGVPIQDIHFPALVDDPAVLVYRTLIESFRSGTLVEGLPWLSATGLTLGENATTA